MQARWCISLIWSMFRQLFNNISVANIIHNNMCDLSIKSYPSITNLNPTTYQFLNTNNNQCLYRRWIQCYLICKPFLKTYLNCCDSSVSHKNLLFRIRVDIILSFSKAMNSLKGFSWTNELICIFHEVSA